NTIGGFQPSVETANNFSGNHRYGVEITGSANHNSVFNSLIGVSDATGKAIPNAMGGVYLGPQTSYTTLGGAGRAMNQIVNNSGPGVVIQGARRNVLQGNDISSNAVGGVKVVSAPGNQIGTSTAGNNISQNAGNGLDLSGNVNGSQVQYNDIKNNAGSGVSVVGTRNLVIGGPLRSYGNNIVANRAYGIIASGYCGGTVLQNNTTVANGQGSVNLTNSKGVQYIS
ncbi:MAG TPA: right-handed parallel beta-helix repeat-containing protein, partial [Isosphaeraceae bacterium]|nr:right-handed parallel beta-helix repeat-containing protein [Isosphaeraceae bacterium]